MKKQAGFTLLEIMVVVVILGILAGVIVPNVIGQIDRASVQKAKSDLAAYESAIKQYYLDNRFYPSMDQGLAALQNRPSGDPEPKMYPSGGYLKVQPDPWKNDYIYLYPGEFGDFDIYSKGADGVDGTEDDIGTWNKDEF